MRFVREFSNVYLTSLFNHSPSLKKQPISNTQDEELQQTIKVLHPSIGSSKSIVQSDQIRNIHWSTVSDQLHTAKTSNSSSNTNTANLKAKAREVSYIRKPAECMRRYTKLRGAAKSGAEKSGASKGPWTKEEDRKVIALVQQHGPKRWSQIASELPGECSLWLCVDLFCVYRRVMRLVLRVTLCC